MQAKRPKIGIVAHNITEIGGMERVLTELITRLQEDFSVCVFASEFTIKVGPNVEFIKIPVPQKPFPLKYLLFAILGLWKIRKHKTDLLHTTGAIVFNRCDISTVHFCYTGYLAKNKGDPFTADETISFWRKANFWIIRKMALLFEKYSYRPAKCGKLVTVSEGIRHEIIDNLGYPQGDVLTIPNGVDLVRFHNQNKTDARREIIERHNLPEESFLCLFVGSSWVRKGLLFILQALAQINKTQQRIAPYLIVVGPGDELKYRQIASSLGIEGRVVFAGKRSDVQLYYAASDIFVFPSLYEACPLVVFEAAASGIPVLGTKINGVEDFLQDGINGFFVEQNPEDIAEKLQLLMNNVSLREQMATAARESVKQYTWDEMYQKQKRLYQQLLDKLD